jgi:DNA-binding transcriptional ArsR family regulator
MPEASLDSSAAGAIFNQMVEQQSAQLDKVFRALADPTRRAILRQLSAGERSIGELAAPFRMSFAGASKHVKTLEDAGLIRRDVRGRTHVCALEARRMEAALDWLRFYERFWTHHLDLLERELNKPEPGTGKRRRR